MNKDILENLDDFFEQDSKIANEFSFSDEDFSDKSRMSNPIFKSIGYPSKIYYPNIQKYIRSYTKPGGVVLDSCSGSGSTGIAALLEGRKAILIDDSPLAINMSFNILNPIDFKLLDKEFKKLVETVSDDIQSLYKTKMSYGETGIADVIIASNVYECPKCSQEIILFKNETGVRSEYKCPHCGSTINIANKEIKDLQIDKRRPVEVTVLPLKGKGKEVRPIFPEDIDIWEEEYKKAEEKYQNLWEPQEQIVHNRAYPRVGGWPGFPIHSTVGKLFPKKNLLALKIINDYIENNIKDNDIQSFLKFIFLETLFRTSSRLFTGSGIKNVYHIPPVGKEQNVLTVLNRKYRSIVKAKKFLQDQLELRSIESRLKIIKHDAKALPIPSNVVDYAFIDPPYGGMVPYAELNLFYSAWLHEKEDLENEIMIPMDFEKKEGYVEIWGKYIEEAFGEVYRVLKPGAFFTVAFHSKFSNIWNELKDIMQERLGFQFINIVENERGTTFHTNHLNDTNPVTAFITYQKPIRPIHSSEPKQESPFLYFKKEFLNEPKSFRAIQSEIIKLVNLKNLSQVPSDLEIESWLRLNFEFNPETGLYRTK